MEDHSGYSALLDDVDMGREEDIDLKMEPPRLQCHVCCKVMGHRSSLYKHLKYIHKIEPAQRLPITCREKDCYQSFTFIDPFRRHLAEQHGFNIVVDKYVFQSMKEFFCWKKMTEQEENLRFIVSTGPRSSKGGKTHYYRCQKNGTYKPEMKKRLQSDDRKSVYNVSRTHCISSMCVFEEAERVTVEFCRTHYGHEMDTNENRPVPHAEGEIEIEGQVEGDGEGEMEVEDGEEEVEEEGEAENLTHDNNLSFEVIDTVDKLNSFLSKKDRAALTTILNENHHLLQETEELFYENEHDTMLKIPFHILRKIYEDGMKDLDDSDTDAGVTTTETDGDLSDDKCDDNESDSRDSTILESLGNGVFLDPKSNKRLKLGSIRKKIMDESQSPSGSPVLRVPNGKERDKNNTMLVKEYLNEFDEKVYVLEPMADEDTILQKREKILSQLQSILMIVNNEEDIEILDEIERHLSKYAVPE